MSTVNEIPAAGAPAVALPELVAWYRGEFAAANAIIDLLCGHISEMAGNEGQYQRVLAAIHRRRLNWIPVIHMQKYYSVANIAEELRRVATEKIVKESEREPEPPEGVKGSDSSSSDTSDQKVTLENGAEDNGPHDQLIPMKNVELCTDHENCMARLDTIKTLKGFVAKEAVKGHMVNVVKGLKVFHDIFTDSELLRLSEYISELRLAGRKGELSGETFICFNKQIKGSKREIIQLGVPPFQPTNNEVTSHVEEIPPVLQTVIDHLVQWRLVPESKKPNSCIINFFDEDEHSQPYFKPPHLENPISTLVLNETTMAFGRTLVSDTNGSYTGSLALQIKEGSLVVMRGNSADMARHVVCASPNRRVSITFVKVRPASNQIDAPVSPSSKAMTLWQPAIPPVQEMPVSRLVAYPHGVIPASYALALRAPVVMLAQPTAMVMSPNKKTSNVGTGVFLPWGVTPKKYTKHLPPRIQKRRMQSLTPLEAQA